MQGDEFEQLNKLIAELNTEKVKKPDYPSKEDILLFNRLMFFKPGPNEDVWTGYIYRTTDDPTSKYDKYAIVLTPKCDLVRGKTRVLTCFAFPLDKKCFKDPEYPPHKFDPAVLLRQETDTNSLVDFMKKRYLDQKGKLPENLHSIWNFMDEKETYSRIEKIKKLRNSVFRQVF